MEELRGIWAPDTATYLTDMRHPVIRREWELRQMEKGRHPSDAATLRERRQFDREMIAKYGDACPPPARTKWQLITYDIMDAQEERERAEQMAARMLAVAILTNIKEEYIDEAI